MDSIRIGKYMMLELLGSGATAEVYHTRDSMLGREVALKVLKPALVVVSKLKKGGKAK
jgi:eukaryotic-like serine/threonine-protein kinase